MYLLRFENGAEWEVPGLSGPPEEVIYYHDGQAEVDFQFRLVGNCWPSGKMLYLEQKRPCRTFDQRED
jgi:hypothetical protein